MARNLVNGEICTPFDAKFYANFSLKFMNLHIKAYQKVTKIFHSNSNTRTTQVILQFEHLFRMHTIYTRNNMGQKCEGNCGLWVPNEILKKSYPENLKKIVGAV